MNCPYCGEAMEQGIIQSPQEIAWSSKKHFFGRAMFHKDSIVLAELDMIKGTVVVAFICKKCKKVIIDYKDKKENTNTFY